jgi:hypothetical protein
MTKDSELIEVKINAINNERLKLYEENELIGMQN